MEVIRHDRDPDRLDHYLALVEDTLIHVRAMGEGQLSDLADTVANIPSLLTRWSSANQTWIRNDILAYEAKYPATAGKYSPFVTMAGSSDSSRSTTLRSRGRKRARRRIISQSESGGYTPAKG